MERSTAENLVAWFSSLNLFISPHLSNLKATIEEALANLCKLQEASDPQIIDPKNHEAIMDLSQNYLYLCSYHLSRSNFSKAKLLLDRSQRLLHVLPEFKDSVKMANIKLCSVIMSALLEQRNPQAMLDILWLRLKDFQMKGIDRYSQALYEGLVALACLGQGEESIFYNRSNMMRDTLQRSLHSKINGQSDITLDIIVFSKKHPHVNRTALESLCVTSLVFDLWISVKGNGRHSASQDSKKLKALRSLTSELSPTFFQAIEPMLVEIEVQVQKNPDSDPKIAIKLNADDSNKPVRRATRGLTSGMAAILKRTSDHLRSATDHQTAANLFVFNSDVFDYKPAVTVSRLFGSHRHSLTMADDTIRDKSAREGTYTGPSEWSHSSTTQAFASSKRFIHRRQTTCADSASKGLTTEPSRSRKKLDPGIGIDLKIHASYLTQVKALTDKSVKLMMIKKAKEFPEGVPRDEGGNIVIGGRRMKSVGKAAISPGRLMAESEKMMIARPNSKHGRTYSAKVIISKKIVEKMEDRETAAINLQSQQNKSLASRPCSARMHGIKSVYGVAKTCKSNGRQREVKSSDRCETIFEGKESAWISSPFNIVANQGADISSIKAPDNWKPSQQAPLTLQNGSRRQEFAFDQGRSKHVKHTISSFKVRDSHSHRLQTGTVQTRRPLLKKRPSPKAALKENDLIRETKQTVENIEEVFEAEADCRVSESMRSEVAGHSSSMKTSRQQQDNRMKKPVIEKKRTDSDIVADDGLLKSPTFAKPSRPSFKTRQDKSMSDKSNKPLEDSRINLTTAKADISRFRETKPYSKNRRQGSLESNKILQGEIDGHMVLQATEEKDHLVDSDGRQLVRKETKNELLKQLEYDSQESSNSDDRDLPQADKSIDPVVAQFRDFRSPQFQFLRLVQGADALNKFSEQRNRRTCRMVIFVLHFYSLRFRGGRPKPDKNMSMRNITANQAEAWQPVKTSRRRHSDMVRKRKLDVYYPKILFGFTAATLALNSLQPKARHLKKTTLKLIPARLTADYPLHLAFVETARRCYLNIYLHKNLRSNTAINQGVTAWLDLVKYLKQHILLVDIEKLQTMAVDFGNRRLPSTTDEKNRLLVNLFLLLVSEKSLMVRTYLGGYTLRFLDPNLAKVKKRMEKLSADHTAKVQRRDDLCKLTLNKSVEIMMAKSKNHGGALESGDLWKTSKDDLVKVSGPESAAVELQASGRMTTIELQATGKGRQATRPRSNKRKKSLIISEDALVAVQQVKNLIRPEAMPSLQRLPLMPVRLAEGVTEDSRLTSSRRSKASIESPVIKDRFNRIRRNSVNLLPFDEIVSLLEDSRTVLNSIYLVRRDADSRLAAATPKIAGLTYPKIFRLNPVLISLVCIDPSLNRGKRFLVFYVSLDLDHFDRLVFKVDIADRHLSSSQTCARSTADHFAQICQVSVDHLRSAIGVLKRGGKIRDSVKLEIMMAVKQSIIARRGSVVSRSDESAALVTYLPRPEDDLLASTVKAMKSMARGLMRLSLTTLDCSSPNRHAIKPPSANHLTSTKGSSGHAQASRQAVKDDIIEIDRLPEGQHTVRTLVKGCRIDAMLCYHKPSKRAVVRLYSADLREFANFMIADPHDIRRIFRMVSADGALQATILGYSLSLRRFDVGTRFAFLSGKPLANHRRSHQTSTNTASLFWIRERQRDILLWMDKKTLITSMTDNNHGKMIATCDIYYSFRSRDHYMYISMTSVSKRHLLFKLLLNKHDIMKHVHPDIFAIIHEKLVVTSLVQKLVRSIGFLKTTLYTCPVIKYRTSNQGHIQNCFMNTLESTNTEGHCLVQKKIEREVIGQFIRKFGHLYCIVSVLKHMRVEEYDIDMYFPRTQKRFTFEMFSEELLKMDKKIVQKIYEIPSAELLFTIEASRYNYQEVKAFIHQRLVVSCKLDSTETFGQIK